MAPRNSRRHIRRKRIRRKNQHTGRFELFHLPGIHLWVFLGSANRGDDHRPSFIHGKNSLRQVSARIFMSSVTDNDIDQNRRESDWPARKEKKSPARSRDHFLFRRFSFQ
jgi:hypothetical protein